MAVTVPGATPSWDAIKPVATGSVVRACAW
jgi:hypothetical protein